jgi:multidrug efflux pump subunit AcrA (membrane-fusion protein)
MVAAAQTTLSNDQTALSNANAALTACLASPPTTDPTCATAKANVATAQAAVNSAQAGLATAQAQASQMVAAAQATVSSDQKALATAQAQANQNIATAQNGVSTSQQQLSQAQANASSSNATAQNAVGSAQKGLATAQAQATSTNAAAQATVAKDQQAVTTTMTTANFNNTNAQNTVNTATSGLATAQTSANQNVTNLQGMANAAQSQLNSGLVGLQTAQHNLENATLLAPHAGIVTTINGTVGGTPGVSTSSTSTTTPMTGGGTFIQIADISTLQVVASVNESDTANLKVGEPAQFTVSAYGSRIFTGTVSAISPFGQTVSNVVTFPVTIDVNMSANNLRNATLLPGMTASVTIVVIQQPNVTLIPVNAINFARTASRTVNGIPPLITTDQASAALSQARQMLRQLLIQDPSLQQQNPVPAYVIEQPSAQTSFIAVPVVLGLTDDTYYVVLQGVSPGDIIVVGAVRG